MLLRAWTVASRAVALAAIVLNDLHFIFLIVLKFSYLNDYYA